MWVTAFADVAELIMGVSVDEFSAFNDEGRKRIAWGIRGTKCNMTIAKTVGEMYIYKLHGREYAVRWIFAMNVNTNTPCLLTRGLDSSCKTFEFTNIVRSMHSRTLVPVSASSSKCISLH